ncbi:hypothetical protein [Cohnella kolymensis]|uniref:hypothetical protein n=1 Tax=Cohnella kolymensis TaxID=1590652 RepID=UPI000B0458A7|nr:hypothetical protein [Cohnella kolymensis]
MTERIPALKRETAPRARKGKKLLWILFALFFYLACGVVFAFLPVQIFGNTGDGHG